MFGPVRPVFDEEVIRSVEAPVHSYGGIAVLRGTLAPAGAVIKQVAVDESLWKFEGPAKVFDSEEEATQAVFAKGIEPGDVVVIRYEGPKGGPGMREMQMFRSLLKFGGLDNQVYLITDGRFSGYTGGACIGYLSPEAAEGTARPRAVSNADCKAASSFCMASSSFFLAPSCRSIDESRWAASCMA